MTGLEPCSMSCFAADLTPPANASSLEFLSRGIVRSAMTMKCRDPGPWATCHSVGHSLVFALLFRACCEQETVLFTD